MKFQISLDQLDEIAYLHDEASNGRHNDLMRNLRADYSGRGMYGRECLAYVGSAAGVALFVMAAVQVLNDDMHLAGLMEALSKFSEDSMGREAVFYWASGDIALDEAAAAAVAQWVR